MATISINSKEIYHLKVISAFDRGRISRKEAALQRNICRKQASRLRQCYQHNSNKGLIRKQRDQPPHSYDPSKKQHPLDLVKELDWDFGPTFASKKLFEDFLQIWKKMRYQWKHT